MSRLLVPALAAFLVLQTGCAAVAKFESPSLSAVEEGSTTTTRSLGFLWGLIPPAPISLERCGAAGIKKMKVKHGLIDSIITYATVGIVISYKVKVTCGAGNGMPAAAPPAPPAPAAAPAPAAPPAEPAPAE